MAKSMKWEFSTQFILQANIKISKLNAFCSVSRDPPQRRLNLSLLLSLGPPCLPGTPSMAFPARQASVPIATAADQPSEPAWTLAGATPKAVPPPRQPFPPGIQSQML